MPLHQSISQKLFTPIIIALALIALTLAPQAQARDLTEKTVRSFIDSLGAAETLAEDHQDFLDALEAEQDDENMDFSTVFSSSLKDLKGHAMYGELEKVVKQHGFSSVDQWGETGDRVFRAWFALEMDQQGGVAQQEMQQALAEIENSPHMTEEQKAQMRAMMQSATSAMDTARNAPESDKRAVRPFMDELRALSEDEDSGW
jgi:coenzyme F420-reducing hydrogenase alpha subunit